MAFADLAEHIFNRRPGISQNKRRRAGAANTHLVFFGAVLAAFLTFNDERREFVTINFRKHDEDVREAAVGDEHLFAVEDVFRPIVTQFRGRFRIHRV